MRNVTKLQLNPQEVEILKLFLHCNPCEAGCAVKVPVALDCKDCKLLQVKHKILVLLGDYD